MTYNTKRKCAFCGKKFDGDFTGDYGYRHDNKTFCSYTCMRGFQRKHGLLDTTEQVVESIRRHEQSLAAAQILQTARLEHLAETKLKKLLTNAASKGVIQ